MDDTRRDDSGFTLVELLVVIVIIGILSAIALPSLAAQTKKGKVAALKSALKAAANVQEMRITDGLGYATPGDAGLAELVSEGYVPSSSVVLTVIDDDMAGGGRGFCLRAHHTSLTVGEDLYYASTGPTAGRPTTEPCEAS